MNTRYFHFPNVFPLYTMLACRQDSSGPDEFGCEIGVEGASRRNILTHTHTGVSHLQQGTN